MIRKHSLATRVAVGALALGSVLTLGACGTAGVVTPAPTATPSVTTILQKASAATYQDATFTMNISGSAQGETVTATGNGEETTSPKRVQLTLNLSVAGINATETVLEDVATNTTYTKGLGTNPTKWTKTSAGTSLTGVGDPTQLVDFSKLANSKLAGSTTKNGQTVWHITGTETNNGATGNVDAYIRQSDYLPAEVDFAITGSTAASVSLAFTKYNSGVTIALPPASEVVAG